MVSNVYRYQVEHDAPALRGECYPLVVRLINQEDVPITDVQMVVTVGRSEQEESNATSSAASLLLFTQSDVVEGHSQVTLNCQRIGSEEAGDNGRSYRWDLYAKMPNRIGHSQLTFQVPIT